MLIARLNGVRSSRVELHGNLLIVTWVAHTHVNGLAANYGILSAIFVVPVIVRVGLAQINDLPRTCLWMEQQYSYYSTVHDVPLAAAAAIGTKPAPCPARRFSDGHVPLVDTIRIQLASVVVV